MKCPYCGAEVNTSIMKCEYCGSKIEPKVTRPLHRKPADSSKPNHSPITKFIIIFVIIMVAGNIIVPLVGAIAYMGIYDVGTTQIITQEIHEEEEERLVDKLPKNAVDAVGKIVSCTTSGTATIEYSDKNYYDIKILDTALIEWLSDKGKSIDNVGIMFSTDEDRNITGIALLTSPFYNYVSGR